MATLKWLKSGGNYFYFKDAPVHASSITLNKSSIGLTTAGQSTQLVATVNPNDAVEKKIHWSSSNITIAIVDQTGLVTCVTPGICTITAECDGVSATCSVDNSFGFVEYLLVGGGGGGSYGGGGGGGEVLYGSLGIKNNTTSITIGSGGGNSTSGGNSCIGTIIAKGGCGGCGRSGTSSSCCSYGGASGSGCSGGGPTYQGGGGGGGASANGGNGGGYYCDTGGGGGNGICGYGGGGGGGAVCHGQIGYGKDGGGNGAKGRYGCGATNCGGGGGGGGLGDGGWCPGGNGAGGLTIICYKTDGSCGINCATGGTVTTSGDYTVHTFTSSGTFCIIS